MARNPSSPTVMDKYMKWLDISKSLTVGVQFLYKTKKSSEWKMGYVLEEMSSFRYTSITIQDLDEKHNLIQELEYDDILQFIVIPNGSTKETAVILYG